MAAAPQAIALNCQPGDGPPASRLADIAPGGGDSEVDEVSGGRRIRMLRLGWRRPRTGTRIMLA